MVAKNKRGTKRKRPQGGDPMVTKRSTWGTVKQGKLDERERGYKNRIHDLETALAGAQLSIEGVARAKHALERKLEDAVSPRLRDALDKIADMPFWIVKYLDLVDEMTVITDWLDDMDGDLDLATGNAESS